MKRIAVLMVLAMLFTACTSIKINNANGFDANTVQQVCIVHNSKVTINNFDKIVENSFKRYGIDAKTYQANDNFLNICQTVLHYTALRSWDMATYMVFAEFKLFRNGQQVSTSSFKLRGKGGLALNKWRSTEVKINELVDQLLKKPSSTQTKN